MTVTLVTQQWSPNSNGTTFFTVSATVAGFNQAITL